MKQLKGNTTSEHQIELEVGMTDHFDFSIYQIFSQKPAGQLKHDGFKLRTRYRFGEKGKYILDPLIYPEYKGKFEPKYAVGISQKVTKFLRIGLEAKGGEWENYIGPVISHGVETLWFIIGSAFGIGKVEAGKPDFQIRLLLGIGL